jgi:hypothetical protein
MEVELTRTGERRYTVTVHRDGLPPHTFGGPGYDAKMPHDLQHFIVERELGIESGIFGFLAAGGEARGDEHEPGREASRQRRKAKRRDERMLRRGERADGDASERATFLCWGEWLRRSGDPRVTELATMIGSTPARMTEAARELYGEDAVARVCACMDELSARWSQLAIGEAIRVPWRAQKKAHARGVGSNRSRRELSSRRTP